MSDAIDDTSIVPDPRSIRTARLLRAGALLVIGLVVAFSATVHEQFNFVQWLLFGSFALIGITTFAEYLAVQATRASWLVSARSLLAILAAVVVLVPTDSAGLAGAVAVWALVTALISLARVILRGQPRSVGLPSAVLSAALAVMALLTRDDLVALIGFFGAYAVVRAVFLGISAFDSRIDAVSDESHAGPALGSDTTTT